MPFGGYSSFKDCVSQNKNKQNPEAYCADIMRSVEGKEYKFYTTFSGFKAIENKDGSKDYYVDGYLSTNEKDLGNDIVTNLGLDDMDLQLDLRNIKVDVEHELGKGSANPPAGRIVEHRREPKRIWINVLLNKNYPNFKGLLEQIKQKFIDGFSITYKTIDFVHKVINGAKVRLLNKVYIINVGMTGNPMNTGCSMGDVIMKSIADYEQTEKTLTVDDRNWKIKEKIKSEVKIMDQEKDAPGKEDPAKKEVVGKDKPEGKTDEVKTVSVEQFNAVETQVKKLTEAIESQQTQEKTINQTLEGIRGKILEQDEFKGIKAEKDLEAQQEVNKKTAEQLEEVYELLHAPQLKALQSQEADLQKLRDLEAKAILQTSGNGGNTEVGQKDMSGPLDSIQMGGS